MIRRTKVVEYKWVALQSCDKVSQKTWLKGL